MADTPSPTVTLPRELTPEARSQAERALAMHGDPSRWRPRLPRLARSRSPHRRSPDPASAGFPRLPGAADSGGGAEPAHSTPGGEARFRYELAAHIVGPGRRRVMSGRCVALVRRCHAVRGAADRRGTAAVP